jgi:hemin uptake protein HemP
MNTDSGNSSDAPAGGVKARANLTERSVPLVENRINSRDLFAASREVTISHGEEIYRLRLTAQNKLILTK